MELRPAGDRGVLAVLDRAIAAAALHAATRAAESVEGVIACIPGHSSLLTIWSKAPDREALREAIAGAESAAGDGAVRRHRIGVSFRDDPDLDEFLARAGLSLDGFLARVAALRLMARYLGFRAGFAYLDGWPEEWAMPRRPTSRPHVDAGTFAIAGSTAGFYPIDSPGGWNLLGRTDALLWNEEREPPNLIAPGDEVEIVPTTAPIGRRQPSGRHMRLELSYAEVIAAPLAQFVPPADWRRVATGRPFGGPFDLRAASLANAAAGNPSDAPLLECAMVGPRLRMREAGFLSWFGAGVEARVNGRTVADVRSFEVASGDEVVFSRLSGGLRGYLAFGTQQGAVAEAGDEGDRLRIRAVPGPHERISGDVDCEVTPQLNRVGIRLRPIGGTMPHIPSDLVSCGMQFGTVQLHPEGTLVAMGPDHPVTGGYLQPMTVVSADLWKLGQLMPGERVRLVAV